VQLVEPSELWHSVSNTLTAAEAELPKIPPGPNTLGHQGARPPLPATIATLQPLVECYFAICSACSLVAAPQVPPALDKPVSPEDVASGAYTDAASVEQGIQAVGAMGGAMVTATGSVSMSSLPTPLPESPVDTGSQPQCVFPSAPSCSVLILSGAAIPVKESMVCG
jgi:hypothetical protein